MKYVETRDTNTATVDETMIMMMITATATSTEPGNNADCVFPIECIRKLAATI